MRLPPALVSVLPAEKKPLTPPCPNLGRAPGSCKPEARPPAREAVPLQFPVREIAILARAVRAATGRPTAAPTKRPIPPSNA
jgi:hypothetical protein